ncbi:MAG: DNA-binding protein [Oscillospiraceae bacterium]|nr:DNA-binding protein [Oscillospiraceae bacterium]
MICLGFDTSNYTTSVAAFDGTVGDNVSQLLPVKAGELGLRQSDALFAHIKRLPELSDRLFVRVETSKISAVGVSTRPRAVEGSYMPCFLAGASQASVLASALHVPLYEFSHQQGHIAAVLWSAGKLELLGSEFLAWHLSGGTTELLHVRTTADGQIDCEKIGGTTDISAGQLIDRTGQLLGLDFPAGKALDAAASQCCHSERSEESVSSCARSQEWFRVKVNACEFSLSGVENQVRAYRERGASEGETAYFALRSVAEAVKKATKNARKDRELPILFSGGVASNSLLRRMLPEAIFGAPRYSTDNAMGIAILAWLKQNVKS